MVVRASGGGGDACAARADPPDDVRSESYGIHRHRIDMTCLRAIYQRELSDICTAPARMRARVSEKDVQACLGAIQVRWRWESFGFGRPSARLGGTRSSTVLRASRTTLLPRLHIQTAPFCTSGSLSHVLCTVWPCATYGISTSLGWIWSFTPVWPR